MGLSAEVDAGRSVDAVSKRHGVRPKTLAWWRWKLSQAPSPSRRKRQVEIEKALVPPEQCTCPKCGNAKLREVGEGTPSTLIEHVPGYKRTLLRQTLSCRCGHIVTAPGPDRVGEKTRYAASFIAHLCVSKCSDSIPQYRLEKEYQRLGIPLTRSTMCSLFHRGAAELRPLYNAACALVPRSPGRPCRRNEHPADRSRQEGIRLGLRDAGAHRLRLRANS